MTVSSNLIKAVGLYLIVEASASIIFSDDKRGLSQAGRWGRIIIGVYLFAIYGHGAGEIVKI